LPEWAATALASLPPSYPVDPPDVSMLPNGLRLIVQPERVGHTVSVYGSVQGEAALQQPAGQDGVASLMGRLFNDGTETHDRIAFRKALDDIGAVENAAAIGTEPEGTVGNAELPVFPCLQPGAGAAG
jgi:zinc protease